MTETDVAELRKLSRMSAVSQLDYLKTIIPDAHFRRILEIGCGLGELANLLAAEHGQVYVTEADPQYVRYLEKEDRLTVLADGDLRNEKFVQFFDFLILSHVLEHLPDPFALLDDISRMLKINGYLFIELPNESDMLAHNNFQGKGHLHFFTIGTFNTLISRQGSFEVVEMRTCNRTVQDYVASNFTLADDFSLKYSTDGTTIRAVLVNKRPKADAKEPPKPNFNHQMTADEYSRRILHLYQDNIGLKSQMKALKDKCQSAIMEAQQIVRGRFTS